MKRNRLAVIGLGNILMGDDGAGLHAVEALRKMNFTKEFDLIEAGTPGVGLLHHFEERDTLIFIDSGNCGLKKGEFVKFTPEQVRSLKGETGFSLHEFDLISFIEKAEQFGKTENMNIIIYCIQSGEMKMSTEPSGQVLRGIEGVAGQIFQEIENGVYDNA